MTRRTRVVNAATRVLAPCVFAAVVLAQPSAVTTISKGDISEQQTPRQATARTAAEWQAVWRAHAPDAKLPPVDFATRMVVGIFLGTKPTDGYEVEIVKTREDGVALVIEYVMRQPKRGTMTAQILTQPYHLIAVPKHADPVRFVQVADPAAPPPAVQ
jgi:hypothetical protein